MLLCQFNLDLMDYAIEIGLKAEWTHLVCKFNDPPPYCGLQLTQKLNPGTRNNWALHTIATDNSANSFVRERGSPEKIHRFLNFDLSTNKAHSKKFSM